MRYVKHNESQPARLPMRERRLTSTTAFGTIVPAAILKSVGGFYGRAELALALEAVDAVALFDDDTPRKFTGLVVPYRWPGRSGSR